MVKSEKSIGVKESNNISYKLTIVLWICQISTWTCILSFILYNTLPEYKIVINCHEDREGDIVCNHTSLGKFCFFFCIFGIFSHLLYCIWEYISGMVEFLDQFEKNETIIDKMKSFVQSIPIISISLNKSNNNEGNSTYQSRANITKYFNYKSCRDVSGKLTINSYCCFPKSYVLLNVNYEIGLVDNETLDDYEKEKEKLKNENKYKYEYYYDELNEQKYLYLIKTNQKILINKTAKYFINRYMFMFFTLLSLGEIYKIIIYFIGCSDNFTIKKVVSSRDDLSGAGYNEIYDKFNPQLQLYGKEIKFEQNLFIQNYQLDTIKNPE